MSGNYLVRQVIQEALDLGIEATDNVNDANFWSGTSILVVNIDKLVNGRSVFGVGTSKIGIGSLVIDDAHACLEAVAGQFTIDIPLTHPAFTKLLNLFEEDLKSYSVVGCVEIKNNDPQGLMPVPFWAWQHKSEQIIQILHPYRDTNELKFCWPLLKEVIPLCTCVFSGQFLQIQPRCLPIDQIPSLSKAKRKIYMTATLADDGVLITHLRANEQSVSDPIRPKGIGEIGDRMIIAPQEVNPETTDLDVKKLAAEIAQKHNVVVLVPSLYRSNFWTDVANQTLNKDSIGTGIEKLKSGHVGLQTSNFTVILESNCKELITYINTYPNIYIENVLLSSEDEIDESENALLALLNNDDIDVEGKTAILKKQKTPITKITDIHDHELWGAIIQSSKVDATWENLLVYFGEKKVLDDALVAFVEQTENYKELAKYRLKETEIIPVDMIQLISRQILLSTELSDECYFYLIQCIPYWYPDLPGIEKLSNAKISHIISHGKLQFTEPNFNALKNHFNNQYTSLVEKNIDSYLKEIEKFTLDPTGLMHLIKSKVVSTDQKITILNSVDAGIIDDNTDLARLIFEFLLSQNSCPKLNLSLVDSLVSQSLPIDEKVKLIVNQAADLATSEIENLLTLSGPPISGIPNNQKPTVENNETYKQLAEMLIDKGILSSFKEEDKDTIRMYPKKS